MLRYLFLSAITLLLLFSCNQKKSAMMHQTFQDGMVDITVKAERGSALSPFTTTIFVKAYGQEGESGSFALYVDDLNEENVAFTWTDDATCVLDFTQRDGVKKTFTLTAYPGGLSLVQNSQTH